MKDSFQYIFRFCCDPGFNDVRETEALMRLCEEAKIDDVCVFANVEELNTGHMTYEEQEIWLRLMRSLAKRLSRKGISLSVNQWHSVMHADLGKALPARQPFRRMVDPFGNEAKLCICPLCAEWQRYIGGLYARYAALDASILWVEDDFRLHNHDPLIWGGCFCDEHMRLYSRKAGKTLSREEFVSGVLRPGQPHPYRKIWLDTARDTMLSAAQAIADAVRQVNPAVKIGLMSSVPQIHAAEGRDWRALLSTLAAGQPPVCRVHLPAYQEMAPGSYLTRFHTVSMLCASLLPEGTEIYPELENYPYSLLSKSRRFTRFQLLSALPMNLRGMTLDLYDLNGNGIVEADGYEAMLRQTKPFLNRMQKTGAFRGKRLGVRVLVSPRSSYTLHTSKGQSMEELYPQDAFFGGLLPALGIPFAYTTDPDMANETVAVAGQVLRNYTEEQIESLFRKNRVLLNGDAAETLLDLGLGRLAGIRSLRWMPQNGGEYTYEESLPGTEYRGREHVRASAVISASDAVCVDYAPEAEMREFTSFFDSFRRRTAPGQTLANGRVMIFPFGHMEDVMALPPMLLSAARQEILQDMLLCAGAAVPMTESAPYLIPYCFETADARWVYLVNGSLDDAENAPLRLPWAIKKSLSWDASAAGAQVEMRIGQRLNVFLPSMEAMLIRLEK
ncbi:MAG: hypothetical protein IKQ41_04735 [Clostridia bacterium]|nr:hypothetical protein [Clostridia bacterium]